jgi:hypothetical protein
MAYYISNTNSILMAFGKVDGIMVTIMARMSVVGS